MLKQQTETGFCAVVNLYVITLVTVDSVTGDWVHKVRCTRTDISHTDCFREEWAGSIVTGISTHILTITCRAAHF